MHELTPRQIVAELDRHIVGQDDAKRSVAIALRNRWRWKQLPEDIRKEVTPKNIIMIGPTGVGKTEITRRLANLTDAPFVKVEASKYTEVGYYGRDVESMVRDLVEAAINLVRARKQKEIQAEAENRAENRLLELLVPPPEAPVAPDWSPAPDGDAEEPHDALSEQIQRHERSREKFRRMLRNGQLEEREVELTIEQRHVPVQIFSNMGMEQMDLDFQNMFERIMPRQSTTRTMTVGDARKVMIEQELESLMDKDAIAEEAVALTEESGILFVDEIDKICAQDEGARSADVSRQGVQRDLLPIVEGTTVQTRYGPVKTDHILFIAAGAFHRSRPSDLMPELQGRFPIRVELQDLTRDDLIRILTEPHNSLTRQYQALLESDGVELEFTRDGIVALADTAFQVNQTTQNIGARRLYTMIERLLEEVSFEAPDDRFRKVLVDEDYVHQRLEKITQDDDLSKFIL